MPKSKTSNNLNGEDSSDGFQNSKDDSLPASPLQKSKKCGPPVQNLDEGGSNSRAQPNSTGIHPNYNPSNNIFLQSPASLTTVGLTSSAHLELVAKLLKMPCKVHKRALNICEACLVFMFHPTKLKVCIQATCPEHQFVTNVGLLTYSHSLSEMKKTATEKKANNWTPGNTLENIL
ncbi:uncharacterized protein MELLADRAFT_113812 [Melampsora larici-populina 98AG31]|uniref:Uncharacterized protein n=1 Tax=Melampsora larici-populina (strain 98AG31 / pathotype 3-4-7) TaxID=747676 RepID=F4SB50_MELLP|nr:uncharacterized protein MELLADRAFT_113812 [Melampsora larici-populina 98AG31]EGF98138.1 hypothetical protein MELLADRAFT_113812 [Melampsora larici-populina 98AG31]